MVMVLEQFVPSVVVAVTMYSPPSPIKMLESIPAILGAKAAPFLVHV